MQRRQVLAAGAAAAVAPWQAWAQDKWGASQGYPSGWAGGIERDPAYRVANYSGGLETMLPRRLITRSPAPSAWKESPVADFKYRWGFLTRSAQDYLERWPVTGLLVCRDGDILLERYRFARTPAHRFTSWSMAKSITSLLLGICLDRKLIASYDDRAEQYVPELAGTLHGGVTLRNLSNMSSGADVLHDRDNPTIYPRALTGSLSDITATVARWNEKREEQGSRYNYNELCPLALGIVMRKVTGTSLSAFAQAALWHPLGAEGDAAWTTDAQGAEFNCIGFAACLRDWARLGRLVADRGRAGATQVVSDAWIREVTTWGERDRQGRHGTAMRHAGYKAHFWHEKADGSRPYFNGHHGQRVCIDMPTRTVVVQTAVDHEGDWRGEFAALVESASRL